MDPYTALDQGSRAIAVGFDYLRRLGTDRPPDRPPDPTDEEVFREHERIRSQLGGKDAGAESLNRVFGALGAETVLGTSASP